MVTLEKLNEDTFECKISQVRLLKNFRTNTFSIKGCNYYISVDFISYYHRQHNTSTEDIWILYLNSLGFEDHSYSFYILNVMSHKYGEYITKKGMISREFCNRSPAQLWSFNEKYLLQRENLIQPGGILTLRLSLFHADEYREQLPMYCTIEYPKQKEASRLPIVRDISTNTEAEPNTLLENLSEDFERFYDNTTIADCVLKVGNSQFQVHRAILSARSTVFAAMFNHETKESLNGEIIIPDVDPVVLGDVLYYIYSGKIRGLTPDTAVSIYTVADKYALYKLRDVSLNFLLNRLTTENICDVAVLAHMHEEIKLEEKIISFVAERVEEFMESDKWKQFSQDKSLLANKLLCSALIMSKKKTFA